MFCPNFTVNIKARLSLPCFCCLGLIEELDFNNHNLMISPSQEKWGLQAYLPIAMAVTAYARINMSSVKNRDDLNLYYTDTDSAFVDNYLPDELVHNKALGLWKLEDEYIYSVFLGPKLYGCLNIHGESYSKVKGFSKTVPLEVLSKFMNLGETQELVQTKWFKIIKQSKITVDENNKYKLRVTDFKRNLIYSNNNLEGTSNLKIEGSTSENKFRNL